MTTDKDWFSSWFNTPYYHILYKHRDVLESQLFMRNLTRFLSLKSGSHILDAPCGKGRHAVFLNTLGYRVTGQDLSKNSIESAQQFANEELTFSVHDIRNPFKEKYDAIFNLFTSFGYFKEDAEDITVLQNIQASLKKDGVAVIDFLNVEKTRNTLVAEETQTIDGIRFHIKRNITDGFIYKHISFFADAQEHTYTERVKYLDLSRFKEQLAKANLTIQQTFGSYQLEPFSTTNSKRLILVVNSCTSS